MKKLLILLFCFSCGFTNAQQTIQIPIIDGNDDAYQHYNTIGTHVGTMFMGTESLIMGYTPNPPMFYYIGLRYQSVPIPPGSTIESAYIQFTPFEASDETNEITVYCENNANPPAFSNEDYNISNRQTTYYQSDWWVSAWQGVWVQTENSKTHNIAYVVQPIIDMEGWEKNNPIVFIFKGNFPTQGEQFPKNAISYEYGSEFYAPILTITFIEPAGIDDQELAKALNIFPNPVSDKFTVSFTDAKDGEYNICLYNLQGKKVYQIYDGKLTNGDHKFEQSAIDLNLQAGVYLLSIRGNQHDASRKVIIQ